MSESTRAAEPADKTDEVHADAVEGGNYDVVRDRLSALGKSLRTAAEAVDTKRRATFGSTELVVLGNEKVRTENNCIPVDINAVGGGLLFGYNVFLGLKKSTVPEDVFSFQTFERTPEGFAFHNVTDDARLAWLTNPSFRREFEELYQYYKDARLIQLRHTGTKLLAVFQTGATARDVKVLRWSVEPGGRVTYIDNRGERDHVYPPRHDFEWVETTRADHVLGRHPHVNILDTVFVETVGGDLTVKVEDNTSDGKGIYNEPVDDPNQSLDDARIAYARRGALILMKVQPRGEKERHLVFNTNTRQVSRIDAIGTSAVGLPEDHGILYPGGYTLRTGETKIFEEGVEDLEFERSIPSPNGEDILYVFHRRSDGVYKLYPYNLIEKEVRTPISGHGYCIFDDGTLLVFRATPEPTRVHPVQIWKTPFVSAETHESAPNDGSLVARIGNRDLVRGISDAFTLCRLINNQSPTRQVYEELAAACNRAVDAYYWLAETEIGLKPLIEDVRRTAERIVDEFVKVQTLKSRAKEVLAQAQRRHDTLLADVRSEYFKTVDEYLGAMTALRRHRGELITLQETRYVDLDVLKALEARTVERFDGVSRATVGFLTGGEALAPLEADLEALDGQIAGVDKVVDLAPLQERLDTVTEGVNLLGEVVAGLDVEDPTVKTTILESISEVVGATNRVRAVLDARRRSLRSAEGSAEFAAQFKLFGQSVSSALALCDTPEACDDGLSRMLLQLEELEARFGEFDAFLPQLAEKRDEVYEAFSSRKQTLLDERQRRVGNLEAAADRILGGVQRRARTFKSEDELNSWFAADPMVMKLRSLVEDLVKLGDTVKSDELASRLKSARQDALRGLRDKLDLFEGDEDLIRFGKHRFSVNTRPLELTLVPRGEGLSLHLTGTDFYEPVTDARFLETREFWDQTVVSEDATTYRAEYLAASLLNAAEEGRDGLTVGRLEELGLQESALLERVRAWTADRYDEGYERGIHDVDAAHILGRLVTLRKTADLLRFGAEARSLAALFLAFGDALPVERWKVTARALVRLRDTLGHSPELDRFVRERAASIERFSTEAGFFDAHPSRDRTSHEAAAYLLEALTREPADLVFSHPAEELRAALRRWTEDHGGHSAFEESLSSLSVAERFRIHRAYAEGVARTTGAAPEVALEAATLEVVHGRVGVHAAGGDNRAVVAGLLGRHPNVVDGALEIQLDTFTQRLKVFREQRVPGFRAYRAARQELLERERARLRLSEFQPRVMTSFVRNRLIDDVYLHLVGDNFAKQLGAAGDAKRTDLMGLLLLISPPGYGKTTLMEYISSRLGLTFVKVNGPALGHEVTSLDPAEAPNATSRQEVEKANLAFEMGNNVLLYLDDIQHCNPEFLQKFISLCDGQRRVEGVWNGKTRTYDLRGKKFAVVMAGNPYTETGDKFQIPDMLANRADTYNLGDILGGREDVFALSFIENALTSNPLLAPLATRDKADVYRLVRMAQGEDLATTELSHDYSSVELNDVLATFRHLFRCQSVLLKVNAEYIRSASMEDAYRTEPRFQLQGSYRNMNKLAEKVVPAMNPEEVEVLITDHYQGESQTLTTGAESNLLKLAQLRGRVTAEQQDRWDAITDEFRRLQLIGGDDDPATRISGVLTGVAKELGTIGTRLATPPESPLPAHLAALDQRLSAIHDTLGQPSRVDGLEAALGSQVRALAEVLRGLAPTDRPDPLLPLLEELRALRADLAKRTSEAPPKVERAKPTKGGVTADATRTALLAQVREGLEHEVPVPVPESGDAALSAALQVIELLTVTMSAAARRRIPAADHAEFVEDLKRAVADAVGDLASGR
ncbi:MAG: DNA repair ATPase [Myxococcota bacterium]